MIRLSNPRRQPISIAREGLAGCDSRKAAMDPEDMEQLVAQIAGMGRQEVTDRLLHFPASFPMDFTREYLDRLPLERLQHLLMAAHVHRARGHKASA